ncbi:alpha/beta hydrolase [Portibacter lacus]|uniref:Alpha/beta hydrolase n=1 Tax=Portibacter lacus TaxID=1099794 RepID=A0AA37SQZ2_9BACT|nr:alpha/beta fold hydrolase [Portibacter lacus]GLR18084.1 alpha/beta hydrolase [Portibacter lacus]
MSSFTRKTSVSLLSTIGFYSIIVSFLFTVQKKLIFRPDALAKDHTFQFDIPYNEFNLEHTNGEKVNSLFFPSESESKALVIYFHGNSRNLQHWGNYLPDVVNRGYDVVAIDYRGYGKSDGTVSEVGMYEDAQLVYKWAQENHPEKDIILWGRSLGTGVASHLSTQQPATKLILETPFYNMPELVKTRFPLLIVPVELKYKFPNHENIKNNKMTTLIIQGTKDSIVPFKSASKLKKILETDDHFFTIKGAGHRNLHEFNDYQAVLDEIL